MEFGTRLRALRKEKNMTQEELAILINSTKANISKYETSKVEPNIETIRFFADYFDVSVDYLLCKTHVRNYTETLAFHATEDLTEEELEQVKQYIKFLHSQRNED
ncbi:XRE family transcriptional regulator [Gottschalkiaceae bacterium SANA]|nr:XRE family transcriptional regulator [Gottschalkiaceae bacterium SANA]